MVAVPNSTGYLRSFSSKYSGPHNQQITGQLSVIGSVKFVFQTEQLVIRFQVLDTSFGQGEPTHEGTQEAFDYLRAARSLRREKARAALFGGIAIADFIDRPFDRTVQGKSKMGRAPQHIHGCR